MGDEIVWLVEQRRFAWLISRNAYYSVVSYSPESLACFVVDNDDYELWEERAIEYESDDGE